MTAAHTRTTVRVAPLARREHAPSIEVQVDTLARESGLHPELVRRFVRLGLVEPRDPRDAAALMAQAARLRRDLGLSYAGAVLACQLLARIEELEERLRRYERSQDA
jgi:chaperone modulatory protein CbpM